MNASSLQLFGPEIWLAAGPEIEVIGFRCPTRMAVIRLSGGSSAAGSGSACGAGPGVRFDSAYATFPSRK